MNCLKLLEIHEGAEEGVCKIGGQANQIKRKENQCEIKINGMCAFGNQKNCASDIWRRTEVTSAFDFRAVGFGGASFEWTLIC